MQSVLYMYSTGSKKPWIYPGCVLLKFFTDSQHILTIIETTVPISQRMTINISCQPRFYQSIWFA